MITPKSMSKRVFGIGIIIAGLLVLSIALILGLRFPAYVNSKAVQTQCILEPDHHQYHTWVSAPLCRRYEPLPPQINRSLSLPHNDCVPCTRVSFHMPRVMTTISIKSPSMFSFCKSKKNRFVYVPHIKKHFFPEATLI